MYVYHTPNDGVTIFGHFHTLVYHAQDPSQWVLKSCDHHPDNQLRSVFTTGGQVIKYGYITDLDFLQENAKMQKEKEKCQHSNKVLLCRPITA